MKVKAPGRVNLIGEHTDYNDGFVLPFAIDRYVELEIEESDKFCFYSNNLNEEVKLSSLQKTNSWADYVVGVIKEIEKRGYKIQPVKIKVDSNIPIGAGLSSSAALEVASAYAISEYFGLNLSKIDIVKISREAEANFVGVNCGIMDQFASAFSKKDYAIFLDTMTLDFQFVPLNLKGYEIFVIDSNVKHELSSSEYNLRRQECESALGIIGKDSFRNVTREDLKLLNGTLLKRVQHILEENERVLKTVKALKENEIEKIGEYLYQSHESLRYLYEVSCDETDFIVDFLKEKDGIIGARMVGGGFGGGVIVISKEGSFESIEKLLENEYYSRFSIRPTFYKLNSSDGVTKIK
ncbi:galactokinase [Thermosipho africanus Ob7]|uniref:galactokinase n=1 Tax=Thermosipho africanus TaxID=2421 RepID=UPI000E0C9429|nr:galactokinase [Thermosipho africanus]MDK2905733.1 galactokinase [Eubacteriaceae bacterium]RDI91671.1 galactokinase [Thermosipho africanus Ob7]